MIEVILSLALGKSSLQMYLVLHQLLPNMLYTEWTLVFVEKTNERLDRTEYHHNQGGVLQKLYKSLLRWFFLIGSVVYGGVQEPYLF